MFIQIPFDILSVSFPEIVQVRLFVQGRKIMSKQISSNAKVSMEELAVACICTNLIWMVSCRVEIGKGVKILPKQLNNDCYH